MWLFFVAKVNPLMNRDTVKLKLKILIRSLAVWGGFLAIFAFLSIGLSMLNMPILNFEFIQLLVLVPISILIIMLNLFLIVVLME